MCGDSVRFAMKEISAGGLLSVPGFTGSAVSSGLKESGALDLAIIRAEKPVTARGVFTKNRLPAAPVVLCRQTLSQHSKIHSLVVNAGNANALTGAQGQADALAMQEQLQRICGGPALVLSTGVIGVPLPMDLVTKGILEASAQLSHGANQQVAQAMLTTDTRTKTCAVQVTITSPTGSDTFTVGGGAKGSGMIHPNMGTMLAIVATDAPVASEPLREILHSAVDHSFHEITVDGDTSTNDTVLLLAGDDGGYSIGQGDPRLPAVTAAITRVAEILARKIIADGEGATRVMELRVTQAKTVQQARKVARSVATSLLVKTALAGGDPNWGRILAAAANAGEEIVADQLTLTIAGMPVFVQGQPQDADQETLAQLFSGDNVQVELNLGQGEATARALTSDITKDYVSINADYRT